MTIFAAINWQDALAYLVVGIYSIKAHDIRLVGEVIISAMYGLVAFEHRKPKNSIEVAIFIFACLASTCLGAAVFMEAGIVHSIASP